MKLIEIILVLFALLAATPDVLAEPVHINTAPADEIALALSGIGEKKALAIVEHREMHGPFETIEDLLLVRGIGESLLQKIRSDVIID